MTRALTYDRPSAGWLDSLPLGNGRLGAMVEAGTDAVTLHLNDGTAWSGSPASEHRRGRVGADRAATALAAARALIVDGRPIDAERELAALQSRYSQAYLPFAQVSLTIAGENTESLSRTLSLAEAIHTATANGESGAIRQETFVSAADGVLVHRLRSDTAVRVTLGFSTPLRETSRVVTGSGAVLSLDLPADVAPGHEPDEPALTWDLPGIDPLHGAVAAGWQSNGTTSIVAGAVVLDGATELVLVVATETTFSGTGRAPIPADGIASAASARVARVLAAPFGDVRDRHVANHRALFDRVSLTLGDDAVPDPDARVEQAVAAGRVDPALVGLLFDYGRYLLIASSRPGGLPATLQGLWNNETQPPWSSNYTLNINTEMNYWAAEPLGLPECHEPLLDLVEALAVSGTDTALRLYGCRGWVAHHNSDAWAFSSPTSGDASWSQWPMGGVWLVLQLDEHRRFGSADEAWLRRFRNVASGAAAFALDWLVDDGTGGLVTRPSTSPENRFSTPDGPASLTTGSALDRALIRSLFDLVADLGDADDTLVDEVLAARARIAGPRTTAADDIEEWGADLEQTEPDHRHVSHLYPLYPGHGLATPELEAAASRTLDRRGDDSTGWSLAWKLCLRARLGQPGRVADLLRLVFRPAHDQASGHAGGLYPNFFAAHPPFQIDGNLGFPAAVLEMIVQSHTGGIRILPALPDDLPDGRVRGVVARPGVLVDLQWSAGVLRSVSLTARTPAGSGSHTISYAGREVRVAVGTGTWTRLDWDGGWLLPADREDSLQQETRG
ncbi:MAG: glycoside hydrolase N-terminal domain-containing protein [Mycetocola sp.]